MSDKRAAPTLRELRAIHYAYEELLSYYETVGEESSLDDEEMPTGITRDALTRMAGYLERAERGLGWTLPKLVERV